VDLDAEAGRSASAVVDVLRQRAGANRIGSVVVLQIGDNGALRADRLDEAFDLLQSIGVKRIVVVNLRVPRAWEAPNNALLSGLVSRHSNAVLVDWNRASAGHPEYLYDDQIHLTPEGAALYASLIADAIRAR
jgi:lysophospholipase L1-like esterase